MDLVEEIKQIICIEELKEIMDSCNNQMTYLYENKNNLSKEELIDDIDLKERTKGVKKKIRGSAFMKIRKSNFEED